MSLDIYAEAIIARVASDIGPPPLVVLDGIVPPGTLPGYVLIYFYDNDPEPAQRPDAASLAGDSPLESVTAMCHIVGETAASARVLASRVKAKLLDWRPTIVGRSCFPMRRTDGQPPVPDESTGIPTFDKVDTYRLDSVPG